MTEHGRTKAEAWLKGGRQPGPRAQGRRHRSDQAVAAGECDIAVSNNYYLARLMRSAKPEDKAVVDKVAVVFPNQQSWGTHLNIAGGAVARHTKNQANAIKFLGTWPARRRKTILPTATTNARSQRAWNWTTRR